MNSPELPENLSGCILLASPILGDPNFRRSIVWLWSHSVDKGALGVVINRPSGVRLDEILPGGVPAIFPQGVEIYYGGPVGGNEPLLLSLSWDEIEDVPHVSFSPPPSPSTAEEGNWRLFVGYAGWSAGQIEKEISEKTWIILRPAAFFFPLAIPKLAWQEILSSLDPALNLLAHAPDDPWKN